jgi:hypothetical protein
MAKFAEDEEIDLGEIGKFKCSFLEESMKLYPCPVEANYIGRLENYDRRIKEHGEYKIGLFIKLNKLHERMVNLEDLIKGRDKLIQDFNKYFEVFPDRQGRVHYHKK